MSSATPLRPEAVPSGTSVLVVGPALTGKRDLVFDLIAGSESRAGVVTTTKNTADRIRSEFAGQHGDGWRLSVVDCVSKGGFGRTVDDADTTYVATPGDLTGIGIAVSGFLQDCYHDPTRSGVRFGLHSLSTLAMYAELRRVFQFVHVLTTRVDAAGFVGAFALDTTTDDRTKEQLLPLFDAVVETRETDEGPELRVRGNADTGPRSWTPYDPD